MNNTCKCGGNFKDITIEHSVKTRLETKIVENLPAKECTICANIEFPDKSEEIIDTVKFIVKREMERVAHEEQKIINDTPNFKNILKRILG